MNKHMTQDNTSIHTPGKKKKMGQTQNAKSQLMLWNILENFIESFASHD